jgi:predicted dehydrogenase
MSDLNRRDFLKTSSLAAVGLGIAAQSSVLGANDRIRAAVVGLRGRGGSHLGELPSVPGVEIAAICDVDEREIARREREVERRSGKKPDTCVDIRKLLEDKTIDVVSIASPNHWHSLQAIWSCQAGKDVYVEKPCSHNILEGRRLVEAARKHQRIVQHGTQCRSSEALREAMVKLEEGVIGEVYMARGLCFKTRNSIGRTPEEEPPKEVHYDLWLGPAPKRAFSRNRFHYNWHWHWDYGNGDIGNQGVHQMDIARWGLGVGLPSRVQSMGGHFMFNDDQETPNTQIATFDYPEEKKMLVFEVRHWFTNDEQGTNVGVLFYGSEGYMVIPSYSKYETFLGRKREPGPSANRGGDHFANFIQAVRSRDATSLHAEIEEGHLSSTLCHLANVSYRLGRTLLFDPAKETFAGDEEACALLTRDYRAPYTLPAVV